MNQTLPLLILFLLTACAGKVDYVRPSVQLGSANNSKIIDKPRDVVWSSSVPELGKQFFVINNLDKASGLINVSYSGNPEKYIDCGRVTSYVKNARGERTYDFAGASAHQQYEVMNGNGLFYISRRLSLEGRVNLIFEEVTTNQTRVTASTRYVVQRQITATAAANNIPQSGSDSISFNSGNSSAFPSNRNGQATECAATGVLEREILSVIK
ncbi:hypothetical protein ACHMW6_15440 [Pseudoduganella sp. UC29_106]|uniref:hypothetical protein n=1 Tax=Pseudoduganella sp. UC29_106 TaxID=3374553 RepID=UPI0037576294